MPLNNRFTSTTNGAITFIGNTLGLSQQTNTSNAGTAGSIGAFVNNNTTAQANATWPAGTTFNFSQNSSQAILNIPAGSTVLHAELIWGGNYLTVNQNIQAQLNNSVTFTTPSGTFSIAPDPATAQQVTFLSAVAGSNLGMYSRSQDVTSLVQAAGNGTYSTGRVPGIVDPSNTSTSDTNNAGWTLAVIYENSALPLRNMTLYNGLDIISTTLNPFTDISLSGFSTPINGPTNGRLLLSAAEGDANISGDMAQFGPNTAALTTLSGPNNLANNFFGSQINNDSGNLNTSGTFGNRNQNPATATNIVGGRQGWDITNVNISNTLTNSQTSAVARLTTTGDSYFPNALALQIDINTISFDSMFKQVDKAFADVGDTLTYTFPIHNTSSVLGENVVLVDTLPSSVAFIPGSVTIDGITSSDNPQTGISIGNISPNQVVTVTFKVTVVDTVPSPNPIPDKADITFSFLPGPNIDRVYDDLQSNTVNTLINSTDISINKSVDKVFADVGNTITYTIVIKNTGTTSATNVIFKDTIPNDTTFVANSFTQNGVVIPGQNPQNGISISNIGPNQSVTLSFKVIVNTIPSPNPIPNEGIVNYSYTVDPSTPVIKNNGKISNTVNTLVNNANLDNVTKKVDKDFAIVGDVITYTIVIPNTGNVTANNVVLIDTIPNDTTFVINSVTIDGVNQPGAIVRPPGGLNIGSIGPGQVSTVTFKVTVNTIPNPNPIPNFANVNFSYVVDPSTPITVTDSAGTNTVNTQVNTAMLNTTKSVSQSNAFIGNTLIYTIVIKNNGNVDANNIFFVDTIPNGTIFVNNSFSVNGTNIPGANPSTGVTLPNISPGNVSTITFNVVVDTIPSPNPTTNVSSTGYNYILNPSIPTIISDQNNSNVVSTFINPDSNPTKIVDKLFATVGDTLTYTIIWRNTLNMQQTNVVFVDTIPNDTTFVPNSVTVDGTNRPGATITPPNGLPLGTLPVGGVFTITYKVVVNTIPSPNPIPNDADVLFTFVVDPTTGSTIREDAPSNKVSTKVNLAIITTNKKFVDKEFATVGDTITYTINYINTGNTTANNVILIDTIPNGTSFIPNSIFLNNINLPGEVVEPPTGFNIGTIGINQSVTVSFSIKVDTVPSPNPIPNIASTGYDFIIDEVNNTSKGNSTTTNTVTTTINFANINSPIKSVDKNFADIGDTLTYTVIFKNTGNVTANNVVFTDTIPNDTTFVPNSVFVNNINQPGQNPQNSISI
ncbi:MAG: beta strand repeat-containing protein, partial [Peptostreptococcaceae bacterium]